MIHLPNGLRRQRQQSLLDSLKGSGSTKQLSREEAQAAVDATAAALDGLKVLLVLADQGDSAARFALRQWRDVLGELARL